MNNKEHCCVIAQPSKEKKSQLEKAQRKDPKKIKKYCSNHPDWNPVKIQTMLNEDGVVASIEEISTEKSRINQHLYPKEIQEALNPTFCLTEDGEHNLYKGFLQLPYGLVFQRFYTKIGILATDFQLQILSKSNEFYVDGTFWSSPPEFKQILNIIVYSQEIKKHVCCAHILLNSKKEGEYDIAFENFISIAKHCGYQLKPKYIMADFEPALRNSLEKNFRGSQILGCQFHFMKALWRKAGKEGLKKKSRIYKTMRLTILALILMHIPKSLQDPRDEQFIRKKYFQEIKQAIQHEQEKELYMKFWDYLDKNWLNLDFMHSGKDRERNNSTNNACEGFHSYLSKIIFISFFLL